MVSRIRKKQLKKLKVSKLITISHKEKTRKRKIKSEKLQYISLLKKFSWLDELCEGLDDE